MENDWESPRGKAMRAAWAKFYAALDACKAEGADRAAAIDAAREALRDELTALTAL